MVLLLDSLGLYFLAFSRFLMATRFGLGIWSDRSEKKRGNRGGYIVGIQSNGRQSNNRGILTSYSYSGLSTGLLRLLSGICLYPAHFDFE